MELMVRTSSIRSRLVRIHRYRGGRRVDAEVVVNGVIYMTHARRYVVIVEIVISTHGGRPTGRKKIASQAGPLPGR